MSKRSAAKGHGKGGEAPTRATVQSEEGGKAMAQLLKQCGVRQFDPRVAGQLLAVMRRHVREALGSAAYLASHSGRGYISAVDVEEASRLSLDAFLSRSLPSVRATRRLAHAINKEALPPVRPIPTEAAAVTLAKEGSSAMKDASTSEKLKEFKASISHLRSGLNFDLVPREEVKTAALGKRKVGGVGVGVGGGDEALPNKRRKTGVARGGSNVFDLSTGPASIAGKGNGKGKGKEKGGAVVASAAAEVFRSVT